MKKILVIIAIAVLAGGATMTAAVAKSHHRLHHLHWSVGIPGSNAELRGNSGNSAGGRNSLTNPNTAAGIP
jgi:hypothetical protein